MYLFLLSCKLCGSIRFLIWFCTSLKYFICTVPLASRGRQPCQRTMSNFQFIFRLAPSTISTLFSFSGSSTAPAHAHPTQLRMVAVFNKEFLSWYLITLKLRETVEAARPVRSTPTSSSSVYRYNPLPPLSGKPQNLNVVVEEDEHKTPPVSDLVISITEELDQVCQDDVASTWTKLCIYKVPLNLRESDDRSFTPQIVSIGPYHHGRERLKSTDMHKWRSLQQVLKRTKHDVKRYLIALKIVEDRIRACYDGLMGYGSDEFVKMVLLDGCFILEMFQGFKEGFEEKGYPRNDPIFTKRGLMHKIVIDLLMLENQLPLFVLDLLLGIQLGQPEQKGLASELALEFFDTSALTVGGLSKSKRNRIDVRSEYATTFDPLPDQGSLHCLDVFRCGLLRPERITSAAIWFRLNRKARKRQRIELIHCVTELREAGIKFKLHETDRFWDIKFRKGVLKIPVLFIHDGTESLFRNLIAFESCHLDCSCDIISYVTFMDNLINSAEDVGYLHHCGIIEHWLGSDTDVADMFNSLVQEVFFDGSESYLSALSEQLNKYYNTPWNSWRASLKRNYFSNPWAIISLLAAMILLLLTFAQTFFSAYDYFKPSA